MTKSLILLAPLFLATTPEVASAEPSERRLIRPADSVWDDAASLAANRGLSPTAKRRQVFQNPGTMDPQQLTRGFQEATQPLTDAGQQAAQYVEDSTRSVLEQTGQTLERLDTTQGYNQQPAYNGQQQAYGTRPNYNNGVNNSGVNTAQQSQQRTQVPQSTLAENPRYAPPAARPEYQPPAPAYDPTRDPTRYPVNSRGPTLSQPNPGYPEQRGLAEPFTSDSDNLVRSSSPRRADPIPRQLTSSTSRDDRFDAFGDDQRSYARETAGRERTTERDRSGYPLRDDYDRRTAAEDFPAMPARRSGSTWDDNFARGQSPGSTPVDPFPSRRVDTQRVDNTGFAAGGGPNSGDTAVASWAGSGVGNGPGVSNGTNANGMSNADLNQAALINAANNSAWDMDRFLLVVLTAICCYVVIAHLDLRNRYRAALRGAPAGYGNPLSEI